MVRVAGRARFVADVRMHRGALLVIVAVLLGVGALVAHDLCRTQQRARSAARRSAGAMGVPPPGAMVMDQDVTPEMVVASLRPTPGGQPCNDLVWWWIGGKGWDGTVSQITDAQGGGVALRMQMFSTAAQGQEFWTIVVLPANHRGIKVDNAGML